MNSDFVRLYVKDPVETECHKEVFSPSEHWRRIFTFQEVIALSVVGLGIVFTVELHHLDFYRLWKGPVNWK